VINVYECSENSSPTEILHVIYHEIVEIYFNNAHCRSWEKDWLEFIKNSAEKNRVEKEGIEAGASERDRVKASGEHFAQCFARYCSAERLIHEHGDYSDKDAFQHYYPCEYAFFKQEFEV
jgi:hypothetical protein